MPTRPARATKQQRGRRTTITLDADVVALVRRRMRERGVSFKHAINDAIRAGLTASSAGHSFKTPTFSMGQSAVPLDKALRLAADLEDDELVRRLSARK